MSTPLSCWMVNMFLKVGAKTKLRGGWGGNDTKLNKINLLE